MMADTELFKQAREASATAYVPYSNFPVGAALVTKNGQVFQGCNIENASFGLTNCAERTAIFNAVSSGVKSFEMIGIYGETDEPISPCGACRQVLTEFCPDDMPVWLFSKTGDVKKTTVGGLLPYHFKNLT